MIQSDAQVVSIFFYFALNEYHFSLQDFLDEIVVNTTKKVPTNHWNPGQKIKKIDVLHIEIQPCWYFGHYLKNSQKNTNYLNIPNNTHDETTPNFWVTLRGEAWHPYYFLRDGV